MPSPTVKLETNIPLTGTVKGVYFAKSRTEGWADQIKLQGAWDGKGEGSVYIPMPCRDQLVSAGLINAEPDAQGNYGLRGAPRLRLHRTENGTQKITTVTVDGAAPAYTALPHTNGSAPPSAPPAAAHGRAAAAATNGEPPATTVVRLNQTMAACLKAAKATYAMTFGITEKDFPPELIHVVATTAHTLFISRVSKNLLSAAPPTVASDAQLRSIEALAATLGIPNGAPLKDEWKMICKGMDTMAPTTQNADAIIAEFQRRVTAKADEERRAAEAAQARAAQDAGADDGYDAAYAPTGADDGSIPF